VSGLKTIWGSDPEHVWAVGKQIYRWDGSAWTRVYDNAGCMKKGVSWTDIQGRGSDDVWVTNYVECTVHWDGHEWQQAPDGQKLRRLFAIRDSGDVGALQSDGQLINWDGGSWHAIRQLDDSALSIKSVWAKGSDEIWSVGEGEKIKRWENGASSNEGPVTALTWGSLNDVHGTQRGDDVWAVGDDGLVVHFDGDVWKQEPAHTSADLMGVWAQAANNVWAVGASGTILRRDAKGWSVFDSVPDEQFTAVWAIDGSDAWAVGLGGAAFHFDGTRWQPRTPPTEQNLLGVWGAGSGDVWVVGGSIQTDADPAVETLELLHWNGSAWVDESQFSITRELAKLSDNDWDFCTGADRFSDSFGAVAIWGTNASNVWVTARCGGVLHWNGSEWQHDVGVPNDRDARGIWGNGDSVWVVGNWGRIAHFHDGLWQDASITGSSTPRLNAVWGSTNGPLWAVGADGTILVNRLASSPTP